MKRERQIKRRTWKYFFEQKAKEIAHFLGWLILIVGGLFVLIFVITYLGKLGYLIHGEECLRDSCYIGDYVMVGMLILFCLAMVFLLLYSVFYLLLWECWILPNWERAKKRAIKEYNKRGNK